MVLLRPVPTERLVRLVATESSAVEAAVVTQAHPEEAVVGARSVHSPIPAALWPLARFQQS